MTETTVKKIKIILTDEGIGTIKTKGFFSILTIVGLWTIFQIVHNPTIIFGGGCLEYAELIKAFNIYCCKINLLYGEWAKRKGLSLYSMMVLDAVVQSQPCTQKQISEGWLLPKQTVNAVIKEMEKKCIVCLTPGRNQKEKLVSFTEAGMHTYQQMMESTNQLEKRIVEEIGDQECLAALHAVQKFAEIFEKELQDDRK